MSEKRIPPHTCEDYIAASCPMCLAEAQDCAERAEQERDGLIHELKMLHSGVDNLRKERDNALAECERLRTILEYYADPENDMTDDWGYHYTCGVVRSAPGRRARAALAAGKDGERK